MQKSEKYYLSYLFFGWMALMMGCSRDDGFLVYEGETMGTSYYISCRCPTDISRLISQELDFVNKGMSTYDNNSALSNFNRSREGEWHSISDELFFVIDAGLYLSELSDGIFDITVGPLVEAWGFGIETTLNRRPESSVIEDILQDNVGYAFLDQRVPSAIRKRKPLYLDLSSLAKGYGVDRISERLKEDGCTDFLVEIGGEVRVHGLNQAGLAWRVGIERPVKNNKPAIDRILSINDTAVATSGNYRNFHEVNGVAYSHLINARTGYPVESPLLSVTVIMPSAMWADGYSTLISVLGVEAGLKLAEEKKLAALVFLEGEKGIEERYTSYMEPYLVSP